MAGDTCTVLGVDCFVGDVDAGAQAVLERVRSGKGGYVCLCNVHTLVASQHDEPVRGALTSAWMVFPDGWPVAWLARRVGADDASRVAGTDLMSTLLALGERDGLRHYVLGSTPATIDALTRRLVAAYPRARLVGAASPPFAGVDDPVWLPTVEGVRRARPDVVWLGLGAPKQELWMRRFASELSPAVVLGVGAALDFQAGTKRRAPKWMQELSLEWLHRLAAEPRRLAGRYLRTNSEFVLRAGIEVSRRRLAGP